MDGAVLTPKKELSVVTRWPSEEHGKLAFVLAVKKLHSLSITDATIYLKAIALFHEIKAILQTPHAKLLIDLGPGGTGGILGHDFPDVSSRCHALFLDFKSLTHVYQDFLNAQKDLLLSLSTAKKAWLKGEMSEPESWFHAKAEDMHKLINFYAPNMLMGSRL